MAPRERRRQLPAIHHRHAQIGEHEGNLVGAVIEQLQCLGAIGSFQNVITFPLKQSPDRGAKGIFILDHEDGGRWPRPGWGMFGQARSSETGGRRVESAWDPATTSWYTASAPSTIASKVNFRW